MGEKKPGHGSGAIPTEKQTTQSTWWQHAAMAAAHGNS